MLGLKVELLSGRFVATAYNDRDRAEWPPHPARLFSALVAAWAEGDPRTPEGERERAALQWLERQAPPEILASASDRAGVRDVTPVFVPVNDVALVSPPSRDKLTEAEEAFQAAIDPKQKERAGKLLRKLQEKLAGETAKAIGVPATPSKADLVAAEKVVTDRRTRQPRTFPSLTPEHSSVGFVWSDAEPPEEVRASLDGLLSRLVRLGHSSSLIRACSMAAAEVAELAAHTMRYRPAEDGDLSVRWVGPGQLERLEHAFELHRETEPHVLPARFARYREGERRSWPAPHKSLFDDQFIVFARSAGPRLPITSVAGLARQFRRAVMSFADEPIHEMLSGHKADGGATDAPHLAIVPLPAVIGPHADGAILGVALVLPRGADAEARLSVMRAVGRYEQRSGASDGAEAPPVSLLLGAAGELELQRVAWGEDPRATLKPSTWCGPSTRWASATPVALDRNPGDLHHADAAKRSLAFDEATASIIEGLRRIGLPDPVEIDVVRSCVLAGTAKPRAYPRFPSDPQRPQRVLVHVRILFAERVRGPLLIGAGRYHGLGLFLPVDNRRKEGA